MKKTQRQIAYDLSVAGRLIPAGTPIEDLSAEAWLTPAWLKDAESCGHVVKIEIDDGVPEISKPPHQSIETPAPGEALADSETFKVEGGIGPGDDTNQPQAVAVDAGGGQGEPPELPEPKRGKHRK